MAPPCWSNPSRALSYFNRPPHPRSHPIEISKSTSRSPLKHLIAVLLSPLLEPLLTTPSFWMDWAGLLTELSHAHLLHKHTRDDTQADTVPFSAMFMKQWSSKHFSVSLLTSLELSPHHGPWQTSLFCCRVVAMLITSPSYPSSDPPTRAVKAASFCAGPQSPALSRKPRPFQAPPPSPTRCINRLL